MEIKRVLLNKRTLLILLFLGVVNILFFVISLRMEFVGSDVNFFEYASEYRSFFLQYEGQEPLPEELLLEEMDESLFINTDFCYLERLRMERSAQTVHIQLLQTKWQQIDTQAERLSSVSIFLDADSVSYQNIQKTQTDMKQMKEIQLTYGADRTITKVLGYKGLHIVSILFVIYVISLFFEEQKKGLWNLVHSTPGGRGHLGRERCVCLLISVIVSQIFLYGSVFALSFFLYGNSYEMVRFVQSIELLGDFPFPLTVGCFMIYYVAVQVLAKYCTGLCIWLSVSFLRNWLLGIGTTGILFALEGFIWNTISKGNKWILLKYLNLFNLLYPDSLWLEYYNVSFGNKMVGGVDILLTACFILTLFLVIAICCLTNRQKYLPERKIEFVLAQNFLQYLRRRKPIVPVWLIECRKILLSKQGLLGLCIVLFLAYISFDTNTIYFSKKDSYLNRFYDEFGGADREPGIAYIEKQEKKLQEVADRFQAATQDFYSGKLSEQEYTAEKAGYLSYEEEREAISDLKQREAEMSDLEERGIHGWFVNPVGYRYLLGEESINRQRRMAYCTIFLLIILISDAFSCDRRTGFRQLSYSMSEGRSDFFRQKIWSVRACTILVWVVSSAICIGEADVKFGLHYIMAPIQSIGWFCDSAVTFSLIIYILWVYLIKLLAMTLISDILIALSCKCSLPITIGIAVVIFILPDVFF